MWGEVSDCAEMEAFDSYPISEGEEAGEKRERCSHLSIIH